MSADFPVKRLLAGLLLPAVCVAFAFAGWGPDRVLLSTALVAVCGWMTFNILLAWLEEIRGAVSATAFFGLGFLFSLYPLVTACWFRHLELLAISSAAVVFYLVGLLATFGHMIPDGRRTEQPPADLRVRKR